MVLHLVFVLSFYFRFMQVVEGNIDDFDCVDLYKQPAFQHPLLKNHKIQETFSDENVNRNKKYKTNDQRCPIGTVPILKQRNETKNVHLNTIAYPGQHFAIVRPILDGSIYRGAEANISIHNLSVTENQYSKSQIWLENGPRGKLNSIQVGWAVHPRLYGDSSTRLTIYWTADGYKSTGCYNTLCPGFVIQSRHPSIGRILSGDKTTFINPQVFQNGFNGNWVLKVFDEVIGYWPKELFTHLNEGASLVRFGGNTFPSPNGISPPMGNEHFPVIDFQKNSRFVDVKVKNSDYETIDLEDKRITSYVDSRCFRLKYLGYKKLYGVAFSFGGPGGKCGI